MSIAIQGLSPKQKLFADILWKYNSKEEVHTFINALPKSDQNEATTVVHLMIWAVMDEYSQIDDAEDYLKKFR